MHGDIKLDNILGTSHAVARRRTPSHAVSVARRRTPSHAVAIVAATALAIAVDDGDGAAEAIIY